MTGHTHFVCQAVFSSDSSMFASAACDTEVRAWYYNTQEDDRHIWETVNWRQVFRNRLKKNRSYAECMVLKGHTDYVYTVDFSKDGKWLASGSDDQIIRIWRVSDGECVRVLGKCKSFVYDLAFSPDGKYLAAVSNREIRIWDVVFPSSSPIFTPKTIISGDSRQQSLAWSPDSRYIAASEERGVALIYDIETLAQVGPTLMGAVYGFAFSPDGKMIAGAGNGDVRVWIRK